MIEVGDRVPGATLLEIRDGAPAPVDLAPLLAGRKVALFGVPGAFTGTCSNVHVPGVIASMPDLKAKGVKQVICLAVNDPWVLDAWAEATGGKAAGIRFLGDPNSTLTDALGLRLDAPSVGFVGRMKRFSALVEDGVMKSFHLEQERGVCTLTSGAALAASL